MDVAQAEFQDILQNLALEVSRGGVTWLKGKGAQEIAKAVELISRADTTRTKPGPNQRAASEREKVPRDASRQDRLAEADRAERIAAATERVTAALVRLMEARAPAVEVMELAKMMLGMLESRSE